MIVSECKVCAHPQAGEVNLLLANGGIPVSQIPAQFNDEFNRHSLYRHIQKCLQSSWQEMRKNARIRAIGDIEKHFDQLLNDAYEAVTASKEVLTVDGVLDFAPRAEEIEVIYLDYNDLTDTGNPRRKKGSLADLLARLEGQGFSPLSATGQQTDPRKIFLSCIDAQNEMLKNYVKLFGVGNEKSKPAQEEYDSLRAMIQATALKLNTSYDEELRHFLSVHGSRLRPDLRGMLLKESQEPRHPLPDDVMNVKALALPPGEKEKPGS